jgi:hypothetical protein
MVGLVLDAALPVFGSNPAWETPLFIWELTGSPLVRDEGKCPTTEVLERGSLWRGDCRSSGGYEFDGELSIEEWEESGVEHYRMDAAITVEGDVEGADFEQLELEGSLEQRKLEEGLIHLDINMRASLSGYWEQRAPEDPRLEQWQDWQTSGSFEVKGESWVFDSAIELSEGGIRVMSSGVLVAESCPIEGKGELSLSSGEQSGLGSLGGVQSCDACAELVVEGESAGVACRP